MQKSISHPSCSPVMNECLLALEMNPHIVLGRRHCATIALACYAFLHISLENRTKVTDFANKTFTEY